MRSLTARNLVLRSCLAGSIAVIAATSANSQCEYQRLALPDPSVGGISPIAVDGEWLLAGSEIADDGGHDSGAATFYRLTGDGWVEFQRVVGPAPDTRLGSSVAIKGDVAVMSGRLADSGNAFVYRWDGQQWAFEKWIQRTVDSFGTEVAVSGDFVFVSAYRTNEYTGTVFIYRYVAGDWVDDQEIPGDVTYRGFGLLLQADGDHLLAGGRGAGYPFSRDGVVNAYQWDGSQWQFTQKVLTAPGTALSSLSMDGDAMVVGIYGGLFWSGSAQIYRRNGTWQLEATLTPSTEVREFGGETAIWRDRIAIAAPDDNSGRVYLYRKVDQSWPLVLEIAAPADTYYFGDRLEVQDGAAFIGEWGGKTSVQLFPPTWTPYGSGWPGTLGVPALSGTATTITIGNSSGSATAAVCFWGLARAQIPTAYGGDLLVAALGTVMLGLPAGGVTLPVDLCQYLPGGAACLQLLELDPGASHGVSFTAGLELRF